MKKAIITMLVLLTLLIQIPVTLSQYGETNALGQIVDDLENIDDWGFNSSIALNSTRDALELNYDATGGLTYENFTTYIEVDGDGDLTVNASHIEWSSMRRDAINYVYKDFGVGTIHDFDYLFTVKIDSIEAGDATGADIAGFMCFSTINGTVVDQGADDTFMMRARQEGLTDDQFRWYLLQRHNGVTKVSIIQPLGTRNPMGTYYCRLYRSGTNLTFWAYTDEAMTVLNAKLSSNSGDDDDSYQYHMPVASIDSASDGGDVSDGFFFDDWLGETYGGYDDAGYIFSKEILDGQGVTLVDQFICLIPTGDNLTVQYSPDNSTWGDPSVLINGSNSVELRDLNSTTVYRIVNMTDTGVDSTPSLIQAKLIYWSLSAVSTEPDITFIVVGLAIGLLLGLLIKF